jgi:hypothetical protein
LKNQSSKTLSNQKRRDILRFIEENKQATFTEIKKSVQIEDSSLVSYHLSNLARLVVQKNDEYELSELGQEAYALIVKTNVCTSTSIAVRTLRKQLSALIIFNAILWAIAIFATKELEENLTNMTSFIFIALWSTSNLAIYEILKRTSNRPVCLTKP